jgi:ribonuclease HII
MREHRLWRSGVQHIAGVDEAGRGPLAGPVVAAAVIFPTTVRIPGVDDSKKLTPLKREELFNEIHVHAISIGVGVAPPETIDLVNIREASLLAMIQAISELTPAPDYLLIDGNYFQGNGVPFRTVVRGDAKCFSIAAASIIAKVTRDRLMQDYHRQYPQYGFDRHKGYATPQHIRAVRDFGLCEIHRKSFHIRKTEQ